MTCLLSSRNQDLLPMGILQCRLRARSRDTDGKRRLWENADRTVCEEELRTSGLFFGCPSVHGLGVLRKKTMRIQNLRFASPADVPVPRGHGVVFGGQLQMP